MTAIELFGCAGGMAEGFRRAGIEFRWDFDVDVDACASYEANLGHRPVRMDVRDLVRMARDGWRPGRDPVLLIADPPCSPWSRAGKRLGQADERDMLAETAELIALLRPRAYLIGNVPGLQDATNWGVVQDVIGGLASQGYCVADYASLDAAAYGVPQHRVRPFWFGHLTGPCLRWPAPTHGDPAALLTGTLPGIAPLLPWVTCRDALSHLPLAELGRPVRLRWSDGFDGPNHRPSTPDTHSDGALLVTPAPPPSVPSAPSATIGAKDRGQSTVLAAAGIIDRTRSAQGTAHGSDPDRPARVVGEDSRMHGRTLVVGDDTRHGRTWDGHPPSSIDAPAQTIRADGGRAGRRESVLAYDGPAPQGRRVGKAAAAACTITAKPARDGAGAGHVLEWPWESPATVIQADPRIAPPDHHDGFDRSTPNAVVLSEKAAAILQGFPEGWVFRGATKRARWAQIGMAMPPPLAEAVARAIVAQMAAMR